MAPRSRGFALLLPILAVAVIAAIGAGIVHYFGSHNGPSFGSGGGTIISGSAVTSVATNNGLTGGPITSSGTIGLNTAGLSTNALTAWNGSNLVATGTPTLTVGNLIGTSTSASSLAGILTVGGTVGSATSTFSTGITVGTGFSPYPEYSFNSDTNTGLDSSGPDILNLVNAGANTLTLTAGNLAGFGTTSPQSKVAVSGGVSIGADYNTAAPTNGLIVEGKIGIASSSPMFGLTIASTSVATIETDLATSTSMTISPLNGPVQKARIGGVGVTFSASGFIPGQSIKLEVCNPNETAGTITWSGFHTFGTAPTQTTTANQCDMYSVFMTTATSTSEASANGIMVYAQAGAGLQ
ncbi:MAG: hypothetical protein KGI03_00950 [Patescibacteria group bacterium]|nr:hypothetical protein [Patescibacteria group bacterium]